MDGRLHTQHATHSQRLKVLPVFLDIIQSDSSDIKYQFSGVTVTLIWFPYWLITYAQSGTIHRIGQLSYLKYVIRS